ncbi:UDP-4-amino-4,6-dideoxy-N-acetyl-beta-L-altrosamine transaminase [bacterium]|nr:UDP-4-amino-4,6-dideoxy-N-acetyl-beta-L-altrosamine transaminase [bacterium]
MPTIEHSIECFYRDYHSRLPHYLKKEFTRVITKNGKIPYGRQWIDGSDIEAVSEVLRSDWITQGPKITEFERALCDYTGAKYGTAVNSGTSALHICCLAAGIKPGDEVITSPITFVASANCVRYCGGTPIFADIDLKTYNIDPKELEKRITEKTKAVIPVHFAGQSCDLSVIRQVVKAAENRFGHKIWIIEDASHALGSRYKGHEVGSCVYSDMTVLSFHPVKHITTGEGGAVFTNQAELDERLKLFRSHGITSHPDKMQQNLGTWYYEQQELGFNYRITDIQAVLGSSQIKKLKRFKERRREIVDRYNEKFKCLANVTIPYENESCNSNFHLYVLLFDFEKMGINKNEFMSSLRERSVFTQVHYIPVHTQPYYRDLYAYKWGDFPNAEQYFQRCLSFPLFPALHDKEIETVIQAVTFLSQRRI